MTLVVIVLLLLYLIFFVYIMYELARGRIKFVLVYAVVFFPVYALFLTSNYDVFESVALTKVVQYSKEIVIFSALFIWIFGQKNLIKREWSISILDMLFLGFVGLAFLFFVLGLGDATIVNRAIYLKNILLIGLFYFFGRHIKLSFGDWNGIFKIIFTTTVLACALIILEKAFSTHFHSLVGYAKYNLLVKGDEPTGIYGLTWTFEAQGGRPRYGAFFANPLELSSSMLIVVAISVIYLISVPYNVNRYKYLLILICSFVCVLLAYSRASFVAFFMMLAFMAVLLRYYKLLRAAFTIIALVSLYITFFAADEVRFFILDTLTFENSSSVTHIIDWLNAVESMVSNPLGIGLAMSGNAGGVEKDLIVGGENQYLIYGVQMGFVGMFLYIGMLFFGIRNAWRAYRISQTREESVIPFVAASVKFGLLLPLFTANAEAYIYVSLVSWWLIGYTESIYQNAKRGSMNFISPKLEISK